MPLDYKLVISQGWRDCWLVFLKGSTTNKWTVLEVTNSYETAMEIAKNIRYSVCKNEIYEIEERKKRKN